MPWRTLRAVAACVVVLVVALTSASSATATAADDWSWSGATESSPSTAVCHDYMIPVSIIPGGAATEHVFGRLCAQGTPGGRPLQILVHGGSYNHVYWDWPYQPQTYSYVQSATSNGAATLALDLPGYGYSSHPLGSLLTFDAMALAVHQVVQAARAGMLGSHFPKVILVGHSMGSLTSWVEAGRYADVDAVISTGAQHEINPVTVATKVFTLLTEPAALDPKFKAAGLIDYTTSWPGVRDDAFHYKPGTDPNMYAVDEATKDTIPAGQWTTMLLPLLNTTLSNKISVPVLDVDGEYDTFYCSTTCSAPGSAARQERNNFVSSPCFELQILPDVGHDTNLSRNAPLWYANANTWLQRCGVL
jgi:pimeloyl-ACP methyl ester carboxylesterase